MNPLLLALLLAAPASAQTPQVPDATSFALELYAKVAGQSGSKNILISPYSVRQAVGMAYAGASGETRAAMSRALSAGPVPAFLREEKRIRNSVLSADPAIELKVANSLWLRKDWGFLDSYVKSVGAAFAAEVFLRAFEPAALKEINGWVKTQTKGRIPAILDQLSPDDIGILLNAVYFKGAWKKKFPMKATRPEDFHPAAGPAFKHPLMHVEGGFDYHEEPGLQAVRLPYGSGRLAMIVLLPERGSSLAVLQHSLEAAWWRRLRGSLARRDGDVKLPRFQFDFAAALTGPLSTMGMALAFDKEKADFTDMARAEQPAERLYISRVVHKAFVEVNEEGTEAAAVTGGVMAARGSIDQKQEPPFHFVADRPFFFAIEDSKTQTLLFLGALQKP